MITPILIGNLRTIVRHRPPSIATNRTQRFFANMMNPPPPTAVKNMKVENLHKFISDNGNVQVIDVRERDEIELVSFKSVAFKNLPLSDADSWIDSLDFDVETPIVCVCHHGVRSMRVATVLSK